MSIFTEKQIAAFLLFTLVIVIQSSGISLVSQTSFIPNSGVAAQEYVPHGPISIIEDHDFISQGWSGKGTIDEPYVLENLEIQCDDMTGIFIANTTAFFTISNCRLVASNRSAFWFANVTNGEVKNCITEWCFWVISNSSRCNIESNELRGNTELGLLECANCSVIGNSFISDLYLCAIFDTCTNCRFARNIALGTDRGILLVKSENCSIQENEFAENSIGIDLLGCTDTLISGNNIHDNLHYGVEIYACEDTRLVENTLQNDGVVLHFDSWWCPMYEIPERNFTAADFVFQDNLVNGKQLGFFQGLDGITIDGNPYGQFILLNCGNLVIENEAFANTSIGIQILFSDSCTVTNTTIANCSAAGIAIEESNCTKVLDCILSNNADTGLLFRKSFHSQSVNSSISGSYVGLGLWSSGFCTIINNTLNSNKWGVYFHDTLNSTLVNSTVLYNEIGVFLDHFCSNNTIYGNSIGWNKAQNARSYNSGNQWDDGVSRGNKWSDYDGSGVYIINAYEVDRFPELLVGSYSYIELALLTIGVFGGAIIIVGLVKVVKSRRNC
jgi:parallel beta-helix repeat protein